jgi:hypothetical protein
MKEYTETNGRSCIITEDQESASKRTNFAERQPLMNKTMATEKKQKVSNSSLEVINRIEKYGK